MSEKKDSKADPGTAVEVAEPACTIAELYQNATPFDYFLMAVGTLGSIGCGLCQPGFNYYFGSALNDLNHGNPADAISSTCLFLVYVGIANIVFGFVQMGAWSITGERQAQIFREKYVKAILSQEVGWFDQIGATQLATKVADYTGRVRDGMTYKTADLIQAIAQIVGSLIVGFALDPYIGLIMLGCCPLIGGSAILWVNALKSANQGSAEQYANAGGLATESLTSIRTIGALNAHPDVITKYRKYLVDAMQIGIQKGLKVGFCTGALWFICLGTYALCMWFGGKQIADTIQYGYTDFPQKQSGGNVYASFLACLLGSFALGQLAPPLEAFTGARSAVGSMLAIINRKPLIDGLSTEGLEPEQRPNGLIELKDVKFSYPARPDVKVCKGYNLTIPAGQSCALVGASGSGKSTVINMLLRFYDPDSGTVSLDGTDIKTLNVRWLRSKIGYVGQEPVLFSGTIADNIAYGLDLTSQDIDTEEGKKALRERVITAAKSANAHEFISAMPNGYDTDVGSGGSSMSGGQKQRIAIARALIKKPAVLLLDEATSALDASSERVVQEAIDILQRQKAQTTIIIAHRLSTIRGADKIAVVKDGKIAEEGTHDELMDKRGVYADLVHLQVSAHEDTIPEGNEEEDETKGDVGADTKFTADSSVTAAEGYAADASKRVSDRIPKAEKVEEKKAPELSDKESAALKQQIWGLVFQYPVWFFLAILGAAMVGAMFPIWGFLLAKSLAVFFKPVADDVRTGAALQAGYFVGLAGDAAIGAFLQKYAIAQIGERIMMRLRSDQFQAILRREIGFFDKKENAVGEITTTLSDDARLITKATGEAAAQQLQAISCLLIGFGLGFAGCWKIGLVVLGTIIPMAFAGMVRMAAYAGQLNLFGTTKDENIEGGLISSAFTQMRTVSAFSVQFRVAAEYSELTRIKLETYHSQAYITGLAKGGADGIQEFVFSLLFWYAGKILNEGDFSFEDVMISILSLMFATFGLGQAMNDLGDMKLGIAAAKRIFTVIEDGKHCPIDSLSTSGLRPAEHAKGRIELRGVNFCYPTRPDAKVCQDYNLVIEAGETVALVGPSGSGKSTIMNLLLRFYDPLAGEVLLDGVDTRKLNIRWLRSMIGYVGQEPVLFKGSVASNIAKGRVEFGDIPLLSLDQVIAESDAATGGGSCCGTKPSAADVETGEDLGDRADIIQAARDANADDFIMSFTKQYDTDVGESSMMVSGGQKQRIAIARALIKRPAVLLLDEATSALDAASERMVQQSIDALQASGAQTTIVIAHRLSTIKNADKIAVIDKGRVVELGKHDDLLALNGLYAELWNKQTNFKKSASSKNSFMHGSSSKLSHMSSSDSLA